MGPFKKTSAKKPGQEAAPALKRTIAPAATEDLLEQQEAEEFAASVRAAQERAKARLTPPAPAADPSHPSNRSQAVQAPSVRSQSLESPKVKDEIVWSEQDDVYRPASCDALEKLASLGLSGAISLRQGESLVLIRTTAFQTACRHVCTDQTVELGGLLLGRVFHDSLRGLYLTLVESALPAQGGEATPTSFTYTPASWQALMPSWTQTIGDGTIVGSYHSHPGLGVFLSGTDLETQSLIFPHDWQIALVLDPIANTEGFFIGTSGRPCRAVRY